MDKPSAQQIGSRGSWMQLLQVGSSPVRHQHVSRPLSNYQDADFVATTDTAAIRAVLTGC